MKVFSKEKYFEVEGRAVYAIFKETGISDKYIWQDVCDGKEVINGMVGNWSIADE